jgi:hypothetical protein
MTLPGFIGAARDPRRAPGGLRRKAGAPLAAPHMPDAWKRTDKELAG